MDLLGYTRPKSLEFISSLAKQANNIYKYGFKNMLTYFQRRISCMLIKTLTANMVKRTASISCFESNKHLMNILNPHLFVHLK
jgi:hypothetical protein